MRGPLSVGASVSSTTITDGAIVGSPSYGDRVSQFSEYDPNGQSVRAAAGLTTYERRGWRRWLVPSGILLVAIAAFSLVGVAVTR